LCRLCFKNTRFQYNNAPSTTHTYILRAKTNRVEDPREPLAADFFAPLLPVGAALPGILVDGTFETGTTRVVGFRTDDADGRLFAPDGIALMLLEVTLNFVGAIEISLLSWHQTNNGEHTKS
jgi:hypothetical protein